MGSEGGGRRSGGGAVETEGLGGVGGGGDYDQMYRITFCFPIPSIFMDIYFYFSFTPEKILLYIKIHV